MESECFFYTQYKKVEHIYDDSSLTAIENYSAQIKTTRSNSCNKYTTSQRLGNNFCFMATQISRFC